MRYSLTNIPVLGTAGIALASAAGYFTGGPSLTLAAITAAGATTFAGGVLGNLLVNRANGQLPRIEDLLKNHHLELLCAHAARKAIERTADELQSNGEFLAAQAVRHFLSTLVDDDVCQTLFDPGGPGDDDVHLDVMELMQRIGQQSEETAALDSRTDRQQLDIAAWTAVLTSLIEKTTAVPALPPAQTLAVSVAQYYWTLVLQLLKEDSSGRGPLSGNAYAALQIQCQAIVLHATIRGAEELRSLREEVRTRLTRGVEQVTADLIDAIHRASSDTLECLQSHREFLSSFGGQIGAAVLKAFRLLEEVRQRLDVLAATNEHGLVTRTAFESAYWARTERDLLRLVEDRPGMTRRIAQLRHRAWGRGELLDKVREFLTSKEKHAFVLYGHTGTGKSRVMLAATEIAEREGFTVLFVSNATQDPLRPLIAWLRTLSWNKTVPTRLLVVWDDCQGGDHAILRSFLELYDSVEVLERGIQIKTLLTCWPNVGTYIQRELPSSKLHCEEISQIAGSSELLGLTSTLNPESTRFAIDDLVAKAEGNFEALIVLVGTLNRTHHSLQELPSPAELLHARYIALISRATRGMSDSDEKRLLDTLRRSAVVGSARNGYCAGLEAADWSQLENRGLAADETITPDSFRVSIIRASLTSSAGDQGKLRLRNPIREWGECLRSVLVPHLDEAWEKTRIALASSDQANADAVVARLSDVSLEEIRGIVRSEEDGTATATLFAMRAFAVSYRWPSDARAVAHLIGDLGEEFVTSDIALQQAMTLFNATVEEESPKQRIVLADAIGAIRLRHDTVDIALQQARALYNATCDAQDFARCIAIADAIGVLRLQHDTPDIALQQAKTLCNATIDGHSSARCIEIADAIGALRLQHDTSDIALQQAKALFCATVYEQGSAPCIKFADAIGALRLQHDTPDVALQQAKALYNATFYEQGSTQCIAIADAIGALRLQHDTPDITLQQAKALCNATIYNVTAKEQSSARCIAIADAIGALRLQHDTHDIALQQARTLCNATIYEQSSTRCGAIAGTIDTIRLQHDTPDIALQQARALYCATVDAQSPEQCIVFADAIGALRFQHNNVDIALQQAIALHNVSVNEHDSARHIAIANAIGAIRRKHDTPDIALQQARILYYASADEQSSARCIEIADAIEAIRRKHDTPDIALQQVKALYCAVYWDDVVTPWLLVGRIMVIFLSHHTTEIAAEYQKAIALVFSRARNT